MAASTIIDVAEAVKDEIDAATLSQTFTPIRGYVPEFELKDMDTLHVTIIPREIAIQNSSRDGSLEQYRIDIAVQQKIGDTNALLDPLTILVEEIHDLLIRKRLSTPKAICIGIENSPIYAPDHLRDFRQFTSIITATYRIIR